MDLPPNQPRRCPRRVCSATLVALLFAALPAARSHAQPAPAATSTPNPYRAVNLNYVYAADLGFGGYSLDGLTASVYTLPFAYALDGVPRDGWTLRLLLPLEVGIYRFRATDTNGEKISLDQQSVTVVPGAELQIPLADRLVVKPFAQAGFGYGFGQGVGNPGSWIYLAGARSVAQWQVGAYTLSLGNAAIFAGDRTAGAGFQENYVALQLGGEVRRPVGFSIGNWTPDLGVYVADYYYPQPLTFSRFLEPPLHINNQNEVGLSIGSAEPLKILWFSNPRVGAGVVFGGGLTVWHINFGFPF